MMQGQPNIKIVTRSLNLCGTLYARHTIHRTRAILTTYSHVATPRPLIVLCFVAFNSHLFQRCLKLPIYYLRYKMAPKRWQLLTSKRSF